jgi:transcriptional regulator with GAF, ATPase, and Fis domain
VPSRGLTPILELACRLSDAEGGSVILHDEQREDLYFAAATGPVKDQLIGTRVDIGRSQAGHVFTTGEPVVDRRVFPRDPRVDQRTNFKTENLLTVPLRRGAKTYGVMQLVNKADGEMPFDPRDLTRLQRFAQLATVAVHNVQYEQLIASSGRTLPEVRDDLVPFLADPPLRGREG